MDEILRQLQPFLDEAGRLNALPAKHRKALAALWYLAGKIEPNRRYTEPEINDLLDEWALFRDHATLRRELYNKHILNRMEDGRLYWKEDEIPSLPEFVARYI